MKSRTRPFDISTLEQRHKELTLSPQYDNATYTSSYGGQVKIQVNVPTRTKLDAISKTFNTGELLAAQGLQRFAELRETYATSPATQTFMLRQACLEPVQKWFWRVQRACEGTPIIRVVSGIKLKHIFAAVQSFKELNRRDCRFAGWTVSKLDPHEVQIEVSAEWEVLQQDFASTT
ncbi:hypothetical protein KC351_g7477 [Hortaea werneckii]|nr:hypothetical protein KC351_g7477 [Hortaea werneckii]